MKNTYLIAAAAGTLVAGAMLLGHAAAAPAFGNTYSRVNNSAATVQSACLYSYTGANAVNAQATLSTAGARLNIAPTWPFTNCHRVAARHQTQQVSSCFNPVWGTYNSTKTGNAGDAFAADHFQDCGGFGGGGRLQMWYFNTL